MEKKIQHFVPDSYLRAWCDPTAPAGQTYVWRHARDGKEIKNKDPKNIFWKPNYYTMLGPNGERDLWLEDALANVESRFPAIRTNIIETKALPIADDLELLCLYAALMLNRVKSAGDNFLDFFKRIHEHTLALEKHHNAPRTTSLETEHFAKYGHHFVLTHSLKTILPFLAKMQKTAVFAAGDATFITSDHPCFLFDPKAYQKPPFYRSPGFATTTVELHFPLAPEVMFVASWADVPSVIVFNDARVEELNRGIRFKCDEFFVTQKKATNPFWFDPDKEPDDSWEKMQARGRENGV